MSIARQRREAAAALAMLMRAKHDDLTSCAVMEDPEATADAAVQLALLTQENTPFIIYVLERYAGSVKNLPGGLTREPLNAGAEHREGVGG